MCLAVVCPFIAVRGHVNLRGILNNHERAVACADAEPGSTDFARSVFRHHRRAAETVRVHTGKHLVARVARRCRDVVLRARHRDCGHTAGAGVRCTVVLHRKLAHSVGIAVVHHRVAFGFQHQCKRLNSQRARLRRHRVVPQVNLVGIRRDLVVSRHGGCRGRRADHRLPLRRQRVFQVALSVAYGELRDCVFPSRRVLFPVLACHIVGGEGAGRPGDGERAVRYAHRVISRTRVRAGHRHIAERVRIFTDVHRGSKIPVFEALAHRESVAVRLLHDRRRRQLRTVVLLRAVVRLQVQRTRRNLQRPEALGDGPRVVVLARQGVIEGVVVRMIVIHMFHRRRRGQDRQRVARVQDELRGALNMRHLMAEAPHLILVLPEVAPCVNRGVCTRYDFDVLRVRSNLQQSFRDARHVVVARHVVPVGIQYAIVGEPRKLAWILAHVLALGQVRQAVQCVS